MDDLKFSFSPSSSNDDSQPANETKNVVNHNSICKTCFNKQTCFQISFTESIRLCTDPQCSTPDKSLNDLIKLETNPYKLDLDEQTIKYGHRLVNYNKKELDELFQDEIDLTHSIQFYSNLKDVFSNLINKPTSEPTVSILSTNEIISNQPNLISTDQDSLFPFSTDSNDFIADTQHSADIPVFAPNEYPTPVINAIPITSDTQTSLDLHTQVRSESVTAQFDENFFTTIDDLFQNDLQVLSEDFTLGQPMLQTQQLVSSQYSNPLDYSFTNEQIQPITIYTELVPTSQQELSSKLANNFLYSNDFLNPTQKVSSDQTDSDLANQQEVISDKKIKSGSGIKITRLPKQSNRPSLCLSPTSSTSASNSQTSLNDTPTDLLSVQLSPSSQDTDVFKPLETPKSKKAKNENNNFLPWEVPSKSATRRSQPSMRRDSIQQDHSMRSIKPVSRVITKADLSLKTTQQKTDFGKEKGAQLKRALLEDTNFLSQTKVFNSGGSAKDLVLSVLKKKIA